MSFPRTCVVYPLAHWAYGPAARAVKAAVLALAAVVLLAAAPARAEAVRVTAFGDSLSAGYNLPHDAAFPNQLQAALAERGLNVAVSNAGVSGDTTAGGLARLDWMLAESPDVVPDVVIVELGANDALRGIAPAQVEKNLDAILTRLKAEGVSVVLAGMLAPPNMGKDYGAAFNALYPRLAERHGVAFYPFFLDGVAARADLLQRDGMHPTAEGVAEIVRRILPTVAAAVEARGHPSGSATR
ncbi:arylesterase [Novispirillum sp. DQ9]|uniref:arylesterase n=1 Tax=Novispirillum sp. DQ9 TaxID=3398612 RepID=UPI003C79E756